MNRLRVVVAVGLAAFLGVAAGMGISGGPAWGQAQPAGTSVAQAPPGSGRLAGADGSFARVAELVKPAVINVATESRIAGKTPTEEFFGDEFFKRFYGGEAPERTPRHSLGSGVIVDASGIALTNAHVVEKATQIEVTTVDGSKHKAKVVGVDKKTDIAVLRLDDGKGKFPFVRLGDSDRMQVGDWVIAVGSPFGLQSTVTAGIVSAKARRIGVGPFDDFLQTDAAINPGNSGGPLVNMQGEVIGINTAIVAGGSGVGFAVPSNLVRDVYAQLASTGKVSRGYLGVSLQPLTPELAKSFAARDAKGVLVSEVVPNSPAARAGLKAGDIISEVDGKAVETPADLARTIGLSHAGKQTRLTLWSERAQKTVAVTLGDTPNEKAEKAEKALSGLGIEVRPVTPQIAKQLDLESTEGVVVSRVEEGSPADEAGVQPRDVIKEINRQPVKTPADFERLTKGASKKDPVRMRLTRGGQSFFVAIAPEKAS
ncbi:MAG: Do family serine endopeptidase [Candidatus Rokubacteria bacterium]|nr:Do family serine endopeptidase [Candidatus Rokubacteria bacterium]